MDEKSTVIGIFLGLIGVFVGMAIKGANMAILINPAAFLIIFVGTAASIFIAFPMSEVKKFPTLLKIAFTEQKLIPKAELIRLFTEWAMITRHEGLLALESHVDEIEEPFLRNGMRMIIDGNDHDFVRDVLMEEIAATEERHKVGASMFSQAGTYAPTLGVLGAVVGLIGALSNMSDSDVLVLRFLCICCDFAWNFFRLCALASDCEQTETSVAKRDRIKIDDRGRSFVHSVWCINDCH